MPRLSKFVADKCGDVVGQLFSIVMDCMLVVAWWFFQHGEKLLMVKIAHYFGPEYAVGGVDHWCVDAVTIGVSCVVFASVIVIAVSDFCVLVLYSIDKVVSIFREIRKNRV